MIAIEHINNLQQKQSIARAFGRAAKHYDSYAELQKITGIHLLNKCLQAHSQSQFKKLRILDAGCGTGFFAAHWRELGHEVIALDLSEQMLAVAAHNQTANSYVLGDLEHLPFANNSFDLCFSNLALQWCQLSLVLAELQRVTRKKGLIGFSTLSQPSLDQLRHAFAAIDHYPHTHQFLTADLIADICCNTYSGHLTEKIYHQHFVTLPELLHSLKGIGATSILSGRRKGLMTKHQFSLLNQAFPRTDEKFTLSYHIQYGVIHCDK